ncbi:MAG: hypothetical protein CMP14_09365 [Rickettsiales bacterium]|nr:hypothetical protein [Rickettsiales bacterium]
MKYFTQSSIIFLLSVLGFTSNALSIETQQCEQRRTVLQYLSNEYSEKPVAMGVAENGGLIEVLSSQKGNTFTIIVTSPEGETCMVAAGEDWQGLIRQFSPRT